MTSVKLNKAARAGFEPAQRHSECRVLPLDDLAINDVVASTIKSTFPGNRTPPNCFEDSHASTTLERHISIRRSEVGIRKSKLKSSEFRPPNYDFKKEGRVVIEPTRCCLTGTCSTTELSTLSFQFGGFSIRRSEVEIRKFIFGPSDF